MKKEYDAIVIGCGAAGMAAALELRKQGFKTAVIEREEHPGGILMQCIHNGFGLHNFKQELTGPEYAERFWNELSQSGADVYCGSTAVSLSSRDSVKELTVYSSTHGVMFMESCAVVLAMGCRERTRGNIGIPGSRPAGIFTAGLTQRLMNIEGLLPGQRVVIVGSGDIGLIMARRLMWAGAKVMAVVEIMPYPSGIPRNIVQCLDDFGIPLYLSHTVSHIDGKERVESVEISPLKDDTPDTKNSFKIECDTILLSVGLMPENEISRAAGIEISPDTNGPYVNGNLMTNIEGIFACGNVLHVHDVVDFVSQEAAICGQRVAEYLNGTKGGRQIPVYAGKNVRYVMPQQCEPSNTSTFSLRSMVVEDDVRCVVRSNDNIITEVKLRHVQPAEMIRLDISTDQLAIAKESLEISLEHGNE